MTGWDESDKIKRLKSQLACEQNEADRMLEYILGSSSSLKKRQPSKKQVLSPDI